MNSSTRVTDWAKMKRPSASTITQMEIAGTSSVLCMKSKVTWRPTLNTDKAPQGKISSVHKYAAKETGGGLWWQK